MTSHVWDYGLGFPGCMQKKTNKQKSWPLKHGLNMVTQYAPAHYYTPVLLLHSWKWNMAGHHTMSWVYLSASDILIDSWEWSLTLLSWNTQYFYYSISLWKYRIFQILVVLYLMQMYSSLDHSSLCLENACKQATQSQRLCVTCTGTFRIGLNHCSHYITTVPL